MAAFFVAFSNAFGQVTTGREAAHVLGSLRQDKSRLFDHAICLCTQANEIDWNDDAPADVFYLSFSDNLSTGFEALVMDNQ